MQVQGARSPTAWETLPKAMASDVAQTSAAHDDGFDVLALGAVENALGGRPLVKSQRLGTDSGTCRLVAGELQHAGADLTQQGVRNRPLQGVVVLQPFCVR